SGQLLHINNKAIEILKLKDHQLNDAETIHHLIQQSAAFKSYAESFKNRYTHIIKNKKTILGEVVEVNTHQIFKRDYLPILQNGNYIGAVWIWEDDTHRIQTQDNLYLQKHFFEKILFSLPLDVAVFNHQGKQILSSQHFNQNDHQWKIDYFLNSASDQIEWEESFE
ncbi:hypothetical protein ABQG68_19450, partial [Bacillus pumilus]|uniref:hypothetical protein n=1 Tax=Bacillus pumilus TaxID=1408 RepID=UPI003315B815